MSLTDIIFGEPTKVKLGDSKNPLIGVIQFDCSVTENHTSEVEVTDHPVEFGALISDHVRKMPESVEINGLVTNTPITYLASLSAKSPVLGDRLPVRDRVDAAYKKLKQLQDNGTLIDVVTSLRTYRSMVIQSMAVSRDATNGNVLNCTLSLREILTATSLALDLPIPDDVANNAKKAKGKKSKQEAKQKQSEKSSSTIVDLAREFFA